MKKFFDEFKAFALKGNVLNLAVGIIIGAAFQNLVTSLSNNILSPIIGLFTGQNFDTLQISVFGVEVKYGAFATSVINFFIMAFVVFLITKIISRIPSVNKTAPATAKPSTRKCPFCFTDINIEASRCPACTSYINATGENQ